MIRVLFLLDWLECNGVPGGAEKVLCNLANHMRRDQFEVTVATAWHSETKGYLAPHVRYISIFKRRSRFNDLIYRVLLQLGLVYRLFLKDNYDIEAAFLEYGPTKTLAASNNRGAFKVAWVHCDFMVASKDPRKFASTAKQYYERYDQVVCVAEGARDSFRQLFGGNPPAVVLHNAIDDGEIIAKSREALPAGIKKRKLTVVAVGRLSPQKNHARLLDAHKRLLDEGIDHDLWIIGEGELRAQTQERIRNLGVTGSVRLMGFQSNPYPFIRIADVLACSSNFEGYSTSIAEGLILGKPIVTTDCSGMREMLGDSMYGLITENDDEAFYAGLRRMLTDAGLRESYRQRARERGQSFSMARMVEETETFFLKGLAEKRK